MSETRQPVVIVISHQEVKACDPSNVVRIVNSWIPVLTERNRNRLELEVLGYGDDPREIYDIPEVRAFFAALAEALPGLFYWLNTDSHMFILMNLLLYAPVRVGEHVTVSSKDARAFRFKALEDLSTFCEHHGLSREESERDIQRLFGG